jgi:hypothetical protein
MQGELRDVDPAEKMPEALSGRDRRTLQAQSAAHL